MSEFMQDQLDDGRIDGGYGNRTPKSPVLRVIDDHQDDVAHVGQTLVVSTSFTLPKLTQMSRCMPPQL